MLEGEPSTTDYLCWLSIEIYTLPYMFGGVNGNFVTTAVEGALMMPGDLLTSMLCHGHRVWCGCLTR
jgi:hypothetical protein